MIRRAAALVLVGVFVGVVASSASAQRVRGDGLAAIVGATTPRADAIVLLHSDIDFRARLRLIREQPGNPHLGPLPRGLLRATLDELLGEALIAVEAERVQIASPSERDLRQARERLEALAGGPASFASLVNALGTTEEELTQMVRRRALVAVFLEANLEGAASVTDTRVRSAFESGEHPFLGQEFEDVREAMRIWLARQALDEAVARWVQVLRARVPVRLLAAY
ncbi:MAG: hypothetical protein AAGE52_24045 [Myxococcota bacterium]